MKSFEAKNIKKTFTLGHNQIGVLSSVTYSFLQGQLTTIQGASGTGKTTLLQILGGLEKPDEGEVLLDNQSLYRLGKNALSELRNRRIGFIFQFYYLLPELSALENVMLAAMIGGKGAKERAHLLLDQVGLSHRMEHRPSELSGGEQQRVAIARALMNQPDLILADEPTGNLDVQTGKRVLDLLLDLQQREGLTAVLVTHDGGIAACGTQQLQLKDGQLVKL
ncbi:MAG: ABC transporter ATP-binding protein [Verrucomicrobiae bacterium]|nr:ABC transporter ATP-binding protein [Verrucomicrobiae bacterium]